MKISEISTLNKISLNVQEKSNYRELDEWQKAHIVTCGTSLGLYYNKLDISVTKKVDKEKGYQGYGWANEPFITATQYCATTIRQAILKYSYSNNQIHPSENKELFVTPLIIVYRRREIINLLNKGIVEYWAVGKDCKTHKFFDEDLNKYLGEFAIPPSHIPFPSMLIVGKSELGEREIIDGALQNLLRTHSGIPIFHLPNLPFKAQVENGAINTHRVSASANILLKELKLHFGEYIDSL